MSDVTLQIKSRVTKGNQTFTSVFRYNVESHEVEFVK